MIEITVTGVDETLRKLEEIGRNLDGEKLVRHATEYAYEQAKEGVKPHTKTGTMERNLTHRVRGATGEVFFLDSGMLRNGTNYALFVHFGTRPHDIRPTKRKALRWEKNGVFHFAKTVHHPGYKGDPFMERAADRTFAKLYNIAQEIIDG